MSIIKNKDKRTGITYVYESESYWDKEKQQPRSHRKLIGKLDEATGEIIPTDGRGRKRRDRKTAAGADTTLSETVSPASEDPRIVEKNLEIQKLKDEITALKEEKEVIKKQLQKLLEQMA